MSDMKLNNISKIALATKDEAKIEVCVHSSSGGVFITNIQVNLSELKNTTIGEIELLAISAIRKQINA
ncbi:hypothetical protein LJS80_002235 [Salmonella enterica]|nr:hypothetical protein [Salmonella enterica]